MTRLRIAITLTVACCALAAAPAALAAGATVGPVSAVEGAPLASTTTIASFSDGIDVALCNPIAGYTATINWGDGNTTPGTVTGPINPALAQPCNYQVQAGHTYAEAGSYAVTVAVSGAATPISGTGTATVSDAPLTAGSPIAIHATQASVFSGQVALFSDANTGAPVGSFNATVFWGDGTASAGVVSSTATAGAFLVIASHTYATSGTFATSVAITDTGGSKVTVPGSAVVAPSTGPPTPSLSTINAFTPPATAGTSLNALLAAFADTDPGTTVADYSASINWGDGPSGAGTIVPGGTTGQFGVLGQHTYAATGTYQVVITVSAPLSRTLKITTSITVAPGVAPPPPGTLALTLRGVAAISGRELTATVACPETAHMCRGYLNAYAGSSAHGTLIGSSLFILPGGKAGTIDLNLTPAIQHRFRHRHLTVTLVASGSDPATKLTGSASKTIAARLR